MYESLVVFVSRSRYTLFAIAFVALGGYFFVAQDKDFGATFTVSGGDFKEQVSVSGTVTAAKDVSLGFAANGRISGVYAMVGQHVTAGNVLAETENDDFSATLAQKQSTLRVAEANLASLKAGTRPEELTVASLSATNAKSSLINAVQSAYTVSDDAIRNRADALFTNPRSNPKLLFTVTNANLITLVERNRVEIEPILSDWALLIVKLTPENAAASAKQTETYLAQVTTLLANANLALNQGVSDQVTTASTLSSYSTALATARTNVNTAVTTLTNSVTALDAAESTLALKQAGSTNEAIVAQEAVVAAAVADVQSAQAQLTKTRVIAPFSGIVTRMNAKVGEIVSPSTSEISMQSNGIFDIETYIPEVIIVRVAVGNQATTTLDAYGSSVAFPAAVVAVDPAETLKDGVPTYKTTLTFLEANPAIRSGMTANVTIVTGVLPDAIVIPVGAISMKDGAQYVSVVHGGNVTSRAVVTGPSPALGQAHILSGLSDGEVILLEPIL